MPTTIILTELEAQAFIEFQKHRGVLELLKHLEAFDMHDGSLTFHFNSGGYITKVKKEQYINLV